MRTCKLDQTESPGMFDERFVQCVERRAREGVCDRETIVKCNDDGAGKGSGIWT
jgi:hypothetical protein